ncbi:tetratricopeptide repeat protein [Ekhidna sp.]|uniref:ATP-binding protein n=1 Tax=Ekhidna sp. TaxID=2608089 RepID=UPI003513DD13
MKPTVFVILLVCTQALFSQQIDQKLLSTVAEIRKTNCDSALSLLPSNDIESLTNQELKAQAFLELGYTHYCLGNFNLALENYQSSLDLFITINSKSKPAEILNLIGTLQKKQGDFGLAEKYFNEGLEYAIAKNDSLGIGNSLNNIGVSLFQQNKFEESLQYYVKSTLIKSDIGDTIGLSYNYDNLGMTYTKLGRFDSAEYYFEKAAQFKLLIEDKVGYAIVKNNAGEMLLELGKIQDAETYFLEALAIAREVSFPDFKRHVLYMLSIVKEQSENFKDALSYFKEHIGVKDSLFNERKSQQVAELETKYQTEKKEAEIQTQKAEIKQKNLMLYGSGVIIMLLGLTYFQNKQKIKLKAEKLIEAHQRMAREAEIRATIASQEKERSRYARDLHDGFGQMISILNMNLKNLEGSPKPNERQKVFEESSKVINEMYGELKNICFDLMPQTLIQNGLQSALREFVERINTTGKIFIELNVFGLSTRLSEVQEISLYRISQEWINNILKYSDAEKVTLQITKDVGEITLLIEDNGSGFDKTALTSGKGNGWKNLNTRTNLIKGELELETHQGRKGNTLIVNAPSTTSLSKVSDQYTVKTV